VTLAERLAEAERAEAGPRKQVMTLESSLGAAVAAGDHAEAAQLKPKCEAARQDLLIAEGHTAVLRDVMAAAARERAEAERAGRAAEDLANAQSALGDCVLADRRALAGIEESLAQMRASLLAAQAAFREAQDWESRAGTARMQASAIRGQLAGEAQFARTSAPNHASVLADREPVVRELVKWRP
jgi:hypothetical protein